MILVDRQTTFPASFVSDIQPHLMRSDGGCVHAYTNIRGHIIRLSGLVYGEDSILKSTLALQVRYSEAGTPRWSDRFLGLTQALYHVGLREDIYVRDGVYGVPAIFSNNPEGTLLDVCRELSGMALHSSGDLDSEDA